MLQKPNTVFVGVKYNTTPATSVAAGDIILVNGDTGAVLNAANIANAKSLQLGLVAADGTTIKKTAPFTKGNVKSLVTNVYAAKTTAAIAFSFTGVTLVPGYRYVVRIIYKDLYEHPGQYTHSYEHIATAADTTTTLAASLAAKINAHKGARSTATSSGAVLTVTAKQIEANMTSMMGKEGISLYSQVQMTGVGYYTVPNSAFSSHTAIPGLTITVTASKPGKGNPYVIRDREQAALAYKGITYRTTWPIIKPELNVNLSKTYDELIIEFAADYQSPDNQYVKSTDLTAELYAENNVATALATLKASLATWAGL